MSDKKVEQAPAQDDAKTAAADAKTTQGPEDTGPAADARTDGGSSGPSGAETPSAGGEQDINLGAIPGIDGIMSELENGQGAAAAASILATVEAERDALKDKLLRALAEAENVRRRAERDRKDAETYGGTRLARDLLAVHDNLGRALAHIDDATRETAKSFIEGVELTQRELLNAFSKHKIEKVSPAMGEKFDPNLHQAMFEAPIPGATPGTVIEVIQAGFTISDRLLRPALVGVAKAAPAPQAEKAPEPDANESAEADAAPEDDPAKAGDKD